MQREQQRINRTAAANKIIMEQQRQGMGAAFWNGTHPDTRSHFIYILTDL